GLLTPLSGQVTIAGQNMTAATPRHITELGVAHIPEDREEDGLVKSYSIVDNVILNSYYRAPFSHNFVMDGAAAIKQAQEVVDRFDVRTPSIYVGAGTLSG